MRTSPRYSLILVAMLAYASVANAQFLRTHSTVSNLDFFVTNTGPIFNNDQNAGLLFPRGSSAENKYVFGAGLWVAMRKQAAIPAGEAEWSPAGAPNDVVVSLAADPIAGEIYAFGPLADLSHHSKADFRWQTTGHIGTVSNGGKSMVLLPNGTILAINSTNTYFGPVTGPWVSTNIPGSAAGITNNGYILMASGAVYGPNATYSSWTQISMLSRGNPVVAASTGSDKAAFRIGARLWMTTNAGATWDSIGMYPSGINGLAILQDGSILAAVKPTGIFRTTDKGASWQAFNTGLNETSVQLLESKDGIHVAVVTDTNIYDLNGTTWRAHATGAQWISKVRAVDIDATGAMHVGLLDGSVYTQWESDKLQPGLREFCELGWNPNSGAGWFSPGEFVLPADGADTVTKYHTYYSTQFEPITGNPLSSNTTTAPNIWPVWSAISSKPLGRNFNFGTRVSNIQLRKTMAQIGKPAIVSQEDIINTYSDRRTTANPEFVPNSGYPLGLTVEESIYSWGFGSFRDLVYIRYRVTNSSQDTMKDVYLAPNFDPDVGTIANNDGNAAIVDSTNLHSSLDGSPEFSDFLQHPGKLQMGYQFSQPEGGKELGMIGFAFVETPIVTSTGAVIDPADSARLGGYGPNSLYHTNALGLTTFKQWTISTDPSSAARRYGFVSSGDHDAASFVGDMRVMMATGPFHLAPNEAATVTVAVGVAQASTTNRQANFDSLIRLISGAHKFFATPVQNGTDPNSVSIVNFGAVQPTRGAVSQTTQYDPSIELRPNPASRELTVRFNLEDAQPVSIALYDITGRQIKQLVSNQQYPVGASQFSTSIGGLASGTYVLRFVAGSEVVEKKLTVKE